MIRLQHLTQKVSAVFPIGLLLMGAVGQPAFAGLTDSLGSSTLVALRYNPPNRGAPSLTRNAGSRTGLCSDMTALQPTQTNWGETLDARPTFGIYVAEPVSSLTFELKDILSNEIVHRTTFETINGPGISLYQLPDTAASLEPDRLYRWQISLDCELTGKTDKADGVIMRRVASDELQAALDATPESDMPTLLAEHGLWYDAVKTLLRQRLNQSENETLAADWQQLMQHPVVQLDNLLEAEPIECCLAHVPSPPSADTSTSADTPDTPTNTSADTPTDTSTDYF
ncbi:MAG: DUF928 domain-containing protein [Cyanobacteria bacterium J06635_1]